MSSATGELSIEGFKRGYKTACSVVSDEDGLDPRYINTKWDVVHTLKMIERKRREFEDCLGKHGANRTPEGHYNAALLPYHLALSNLTFPEDKKSKHEKTLTGTYKFIQKFKDCTVEVYEGNSPKQDLINMLPGADEVLVERFGEECHLVQSIIVVAIVNREDGGHPDTSGWGGIRHSLEDTNFIRSAGGKIHIHPKNDVDTVHELWEKYEDQFDRDDYKDRTEDEDEFDWIPDNSDAGEGDSVENYNSHF